MHSHAVELPSSGETRHDETNCGSTWAGASLPLAHGAIRHSSRELLAAAARLSQRVDDLDATVISLEERARLLHDEGAAKLPDQANRHLYVLSIMLRRRPASRLRSGCA